MDQRIWEYHRAETRSSKRRGVEQSSPCLRVSQRLEQDSVSRYLQDINSHKVFRTGFSINEVPFTPVDPRTTSAGSSSAQTKFTFC